MRRVRILGVFLVMLFILSVVLVGCSGNVSKEKEEMVISIVTMDSFSEYWLDLKKGAEEKAAEIGNIKIKFDAPQTVVDAAVQSQIVENSIAQGVDAILLAALNKEALKPVVEQAHNEGIPVILVDSAVATDKYGAFYATDNAKAAKLAADKMAELIGEKGKIAIVNAQAGAGTTMIRENAFEERIENKYPDIEIVGVQYCDSDKAKALNIATDYMTNFSDIAGFYACNESSAVGVGNAVEQAGKKDSVAVVGFDFSEDLKALLKKGAIKATMVQNPYEMGYKGVQAAVDIKNGKTIEPKDVDTGVTVVTQENIDSVE